MQTGGNTVLRCQQKQQNYALGLFLNRVLQADGLRH